MQKILDMKKALLLGSVVFASIFSTAQTTQTVSTGAAYMNDVYYRLSDDAETAVTRNNWDIAFTAESYATSIRINGGNGTSLHIYSTDVSLWNAVDTAGFDWSNEVVNPDTTWEYGAFSNFSTSGFDYGWGEYNLTTHALNGNRIFLIELSSGDVKKIMIDSLPTTGVFSFKYADIDGSNETHVDLAKSDYNGKNFAYYSIQNDQEVDREPLSVDWDLLFTKYITNYTGVWYPVTGVLSNNLNIVEVSGVDVNISQGSDGTTDTKINTIGFDWKSFNMTTFTYDITSDLSYFVEDQNGDIYKLVFTDFEGSSTGNYVFTKELVSAAGIDQNDINILSVFPNPAKEMLTISYAANTDQEMLLQVYDLSGKLITQNQLGQANGLQQTILNVSDWQNGLYLVSIASGNSVVKEKIIINK